MKFAIFGNNQSGKIVFEKAIKFSNLVKVDGYITLGNHTGDGTKSSRWLNEFFEPFRKLEPYPTWGNWFGCLSNKDNDDPEHLLPLYSHKKFYVHLAHNLMFIVLDKDAGVDEQLSFLRKKAKKDNWKDYFKIVLINDPTSLVGCNKLYNKCVDLGVNLILTANKAHYARGVDGNTIIVNAGGAGADLQSQGKFRTLSNQKCYEKTHHIGIMNAYEDRLELVFYDLENYKIIDSFNIWLGEKQS